jgi:hypothetical protein
MPREQIGDNGSDESDIEERKIFVEECAEVLDDLGGEPHGEHEIVHFPSSLAVV